MASDGQDLTDNAPSHYPRSFCPPYLSFKYLSTLSFSSALSIPGFLFSSDWLSLINLMLNLDTYFSKSPGLERERTTDEMTSLIHVYYLLFFSLINVMSSQRFPSFFFFASAAAITFSVLQIKHRRPHYKMIACSADIIHLRWCCAL